MLLLLLAFASSVSLLENGKPFKPEVTYWILVYLTFRMKSMAEEEDRPE